MNIQGISHGKLILFGEHAAVFGSPAVGISLSCDMQIRWMQNGDAVEGFRDETEDVEKLIADSGLCLTDFIPSGGRWMVNSTILRNSGFGSSAAFCVAIAHILLKRESYHYCPEIHQLAHHLEKKFHGNPSGVDTGLVSVSGLSAWFPQENGIPHLEHLAMPGIRLISGALARESQTAGSVGSIVSKRDSGDKTTKKCLEEIAGISWDFITMARSLEARQATGTTSMESPENFTRIAGCISRSQNALATMGLSTRPFDMLLEEALKLGASAGKLSGAGRGGAFYLLVPSESVQKKMLEALPHLLQNRGISLTKALEAIIVLRNL